MSETVYPIAAKNRDCFLYACDTLVYLGASFTFYSRPKRLYIIYVYEKHAYDLLKDILDMGIGTFNSRLTNETDCFYFP